MVTAERRGAKPAVGLPMIEPYELEYKGRRWHGNVTLGEHHFVERDGEYSVFQVREMAATAISASLAQAIVRLIPGSGTLIPDPLMQALRSCGLVPTAQVGTRTAAVPQPPAQWPVSSISLFIAQACNMRCAYCYGEAGEYGQSGLMTEETACAAVDWLMDNSFEVTPVYLGFFGGEPLMNFPLLRRVVAYAKEQAAARGKVVKFNLTTNGSLLTDEVIAFLGAEEFAVLISFDGPPEIQDRQRPFKDGRGSYARVHANVQKLRASIPSLTARATVCGDSDPGAIRQAMEEAGFSECILSSVSPVIPRKAEATSQGNWAQEPARRLLNYRRREVARMFGAIAKHTLDAAQPPRDLLLLAGLADGRKRHAACGVGRGLRVISAEGDIYPCHPFVGVKDTRLGHLSDYRAGEANDYHRAVVDNLPVCRGCWARYFCGGGCFYQNRACTGDMRQPDPAYCQEMKTICEDLIHGWCRLSEADRGWVREQVKRLVPDPP